MSSQVCVDSNLVVKLIIVEEGSETARRLWQEWRVGGVEKVAPALVWYELTSILRNRSQRGSIHDDEAGIAIDTLLNLPISVISSPHLHRAG